MGSIDPLSILMLLEMDYEQDFQPNDSPSDHDKLLKAFIKDQYADVRRVEKSVAENSPLTGHREADSEPTPNDRLGEPDSSATEPSSHELFVPRILDPKVPSSQAADLDHEKRALQFWSNAITKKRRSLSSVQVLFKKVTSVRQLNEWERQVEDGGSRIDKLKALRLVTGRQFFFSKQKPHVVKDIDIRRWAVTANREIGLPGFVASSYWGRLSERFVVNIPQLTNWRFRYYSICDRKITKFVTEKYLQEEPDRKKSADECVALVRSRIQAYGLDCLWNADQSGFEYEMRPGRTLDLMGAKHVLALTRFLADVADQKAVEKVKPEELEYEMITIPPQVTGQIQPLDVLCFRMYKGYFRKRLDAWVKQRAAEGTLPEPPDSIQNFEELLRVVIGHQLTGWPLVISKGEAATLSDSAHALEDEAEASMPLLPPERFPEMIKKLQHEMNQYLLPLDNILRQCQIKGSHVKHVLEQFEVTPKEGERPDPEFPTGAHDHRYQNKQRIAELLSKYLKLVADKRAAKREHIDNQVIFDNMAMMRASEKPTELILSVEGGRGKSKEKRLNVKNLPSPSHYEQPVRSELISGMKARSFKASNTN
ncbi:hypothetical protein RvY_02681 [Ramazzottius varieornatus]|uniref:DDE-1 domain-containing protein n=1 Tax=Ramazzottius varieornatus TaxID=947166 RepID=A0A1D1UV44_RAMVA|nr:hypothetical protein RvY_02681 [Ramazzottius varieornatus]